MSECQGCGWPPQACDCPDGPDEHDGDGNLIDPNRVVEQCHRDGEWAGCWSVRCNLGKRCKFEANKS